MPATGIEPVLYRYNRILSPARLPVPPRGHLKYKLFYQWAEVDSNHRSNLQQIYSLSPLATRESAHFTERLTDNCVLTRKYYITNISEVQAFFF